MSVGNIILCNRRANQAIKDKDFKMAEKWLLRIHKAEFKDGVDAGSYRFKNL